MSEVFGLLLIFIPLGLILLLANLAQRRRERDEEYQGLAWLVYGLVAAVYGLMALVGLLILLFGSFANTEQFRQIWEQANTQGAAALEFDSFWLLGLGLFVPSLVACAFLTLPVRKLMAQLLPMDAYHPVHVVSLTYTMLVVINLMVTLGIGLQNLATVVQESPTSPSVTVAAAWVQAALFIVVALIGVGLWIRRDRAAAAQRLGVTALSVRQALIGVLTGVGMVVLVLALEYLASEMLGLEADQDVEDLTRELIGPLFESPLGIVTLGISAALGEETIFRGASLPRFGLIVSAILFALVHSNYGITFSTGIVFLLGLVLGWVRMRQNTSTAMVVHAVYNMTLGLLVLLGVQALE